MLMSVLLISGGIHLLLLFILGGITVVKYMTPTEAQFDEPPVISEIEPPPDLKIEIRQQTPPSQSMQRMQMQQIANIAVDTIQVDLPNMQDSFTVSAGLGNVGGGSLMGNARGTIGLGVSDISVFGLRSRAERVLFVIDAGRDMVTDNKGGLNSYQVIKDEITTMVGNLSAGTLFNVIIFDRQNVRYFKPQLMSAGVDITRELQNWINPVNANADNIGVSGGQPIRLTVMEDHEIQQVMARNYGGNRNNEVMRLTQMALEQTADAIYFITGYHQGYDRIRRPPTERENAQWERTTSRSAYQRQLAIHLEERPSMAKRIEEELARINAERASRGQPPRILSQRHGSYSNAHELGLEWNTPHPGWQPAYYIDQRDVETYFRNLVRHLFLDRGAERPSVNVVLFLAGDEELGSDAERELRRFVRSLGGQHRVIHGEDQIKSARSAAGTRN